MYESNRTRGSSKPCTTGVRAFRETIEFYDLIDAGFEGPKYNWKRGDLRVRLDKVVINLS